MQLRGSAAITLGLTASAIVAGFSATQGEFAQAQGKAEKEVKPKAYKKRPGISGEITVVGSDTLLNLMRGWKEDFTSYNKNASFDIEGKGSSTAPPALMEGRSDLGPLSRTMKASEEKKFKDKFGYAPTALPVALDALAVFVHKQQPAWYSLRHSPESSRQL